MYALQGNSHVASVSAGPQVVDVLGIQRTHVQQDFKAVTYRTPVIVDALLATAAAM
jgi:hypothetical protein